MKCKIIISVKEPQAYRRVLIGYVDDTDRLMIERQIGALLCLHGIPAGVHVHGVAHLPARIDVEARMLELEDVVSSPSEPLPDQGQYALKPKPAPVQEDGHYEGAAVQTEPASDAPAWVIAEPSDETLGKLVKRWHTDMGPLQDGCIQTLYDNGRTDYYVYIGDTWRKVNRAVFDRFRSVLPFNFHNARIVANEIRVGELGLPPLEDPCPCGVCTERPVRRDRAPFATRSDELTDRYGFFV